MTKQVAYKALSEFWWWYGDVVKPLSTFTDDEHELSAVDEIGNHSFDGLPLPRILSQISHKPTGNERLTQCVNVGLPTELSELKADLRSDEM